MNINEAGVLAGSVRYIYTPSSFAERMFYYPTRIGHYFCDQRYHFSYQSDIAIQPGHIFNYMIFYIKKGKMHITVNGEQKIITSQEMVFFDCQQPYEYQALTGDMEFYWLLFNGGQSTSFFEEIVQVYGSHIFRAGAFAQIEALFMRMLSMGAAQQRSSERAYSEKIYSLLCHLLVSESGVEDDFSTLIDQAIHYMDGNYDQELSVDAVASHVGLSASYFSKQFRLRTGYSPYEYLTLQRIHRAKKLLVSTNQTVQQIGFEIGYHSEDNFIRSFKKKVGVSPNTFRKFPI